MSASFDNYSLAGAARAARPPLSQAARDLLRAACRQRRGSRGFDAGIFKRLLRSIETRPIVNAEALVFRIAVNLLRDRARKAHTRGTEEPIPTEAIADRSTRLATTSTSAAVM